MQKLGGCKEQGQKMSVAAANQERRQRAFEYFAWTFERILSAPVSHDAFHMRSPTSDTLKIANSS